MKKADFILLCVFVLSFISCVVYKYPDDITNNEYQGNVRSVVSINYKFDKETNKKIEKENRFKYVVEYDRKGRKISSWSYKNDTKAWGSDTQFSKGGKKVKTIFKNESKTVKHLYVLNFNKHKKLVKSTNKSGGKVIYTYNNQGNKISKTGYTKEGKRLDSVHFFYDLTNKNIKREYFDKRGRSAYHYKYDENGFKIQSYRINKKGKLVDFTKHKNDQFGNRTDHFRYIIKGTDTILKSHGKHFFTYDTYNNVIKDSAVYDNAKNIFISKNTFTYWN